MAMGRDDVTLSAEFVTAVTVWHDGTRHPCSHGPIRDDVRRIRHCGNCLACLTVPVVIITLSMIMSMSCTIVVVMMRLGHAML